MLIPNIGFLLIARDLYKVFEVHTPKLGIAIYHSNMHNICFTLLDVTNCNNQLLKNSVIDKLYI